MAAIIASKTESATCVRSEPNVFFQDAYWMLYVNFTNTGKAVSVISVGTRVKAS